MKIYGFNTFNAVKVVLVAEELGVDYEYMPVDLSKMENRQPDHMARHPLGKIPVLEHDGEYLFESGSICRYLSNISGGKLYSTSPMAAAKIDQLMDMMVQHIGREISAYFWEEVIKVGLLKDKPDQAVIAAAAKSLSRQLNYVDGILAKEDYLAGDEMTLADLIAFAYFQISEQSSFQFDDYPNLQRWYKSINQRPSVSKVNKLIPAMKFNQ